MSYTDHARHYLARLEKREKPTTPPDEINEGNEKRFGTHDRAEGVPVVWWNDSPATTTPITWLPPPECYGPVA